MVPENLGFQELAARHRLLFGDEIEIIPDHPGRQEALGQSINSGKFI